MQEALGLLWEFLSLGEVREARRGKQRETSGHDTVTAEASDNPMGCMELEWPHRMASSWRQEAQPLYLKFHQSLDVGCPRRKVETLAQRAPFS